MILYKDFRNEVQTKDIFRALQKRNIRIIFPPFSARAASKDLLKKDVKNIDIMIVPGIVFDHKGYRLGYGKGYYDRLIKKAKKIKPIKTIGIAFEFQVMKTLPKDSWDQPVEVLITERKTRIFKNA